MAASGDVVLVAGWRNDNGVTFLTRRGDSWESQRIENPQAGYTGWFGYDVDIDGDWAVIGKPLDRDIAFNGGAVYMARRQGDRWELVQKISPDDLQVSDSFGHDVAIDGDNLIVGALTFDTRFPRTGSAYVYLRDGDRWVQTAKLDAGSGRDRDSFGVSVDANDGLLAVGANTFRVDPNRIAGATFVYRVENGVPVPYGGAIGVYRSGTAVAISQDTLVSYSDSGLVSRTGRVLVFRRRFGRWRLSQGLALTTPIAAEREFGSQLEIDGDRLLVGSPGERVEGLFRNGAVFGYVWDGSFWQHAARYVTPDPARGRFVGPAGFAGDQVVIGAPGDGVAADPPLRRSDGAIYFVAADAPATYREEGNYDLTVRAFDDAGNRSEGFTEFIIDRSPPNLRMLPTGGTYENPSERPISTIYEADDLDEARGDVVLEQVFIDDCLLLDGREDGNRNGILRDEILRVDDDLLCDLKARCGLSELTDATLRVEVRDCADHVVQATRLITVSPGVPAGGCP